MSKDGKKVVLHVGLHKTGSTSFQQLVRRKHWELAAEGILVPAPGGFVGKDGVEHNLGSKNGGLHAIPKEVEDGDARLIGAVLEAFEESDKGRLLISSEGFDRLSGPQINYLSKCLDGWEVEVVLVLRHPVSLAQSLYCSLGGVKKRPPDDFLKALIKRRIVEFPGLIQDWSQLGKLNTVVLENHSDITSHLLGSVVGYRGSESLVAQHKRMRESLPPAFAVAASELMRSLGVGEKLFYDRVYPNLVSLYRERYLPDDGWSEDPRQTMPFSLAAEEEFLNSLSAKWEGLEKGRDVSADESVLDVVRSGYLMPTGKVPIARSDVDIVKEGFVEHCINPLGFSL